MHGLTAPQFDNRRRSQVVTIFDASNTTGTETLFTLTGSVLLHKIWGVVSTVIGANHTGGLLRLNDSGAQVNISASGATLSGLAVGTTIQKSGLVATALSINNNVQCAIEEGATAGNGVFSPIVLTKKTGAATVLEYLYATTDTPTSGAVTWLAEWEPYSADGNLQ